MALARQYAPAQQQQPEYGPPVCEIDQPGPENAWGYEQLLGGESAVEPQGTGSLLGLFSASNDKVDATLDAADDVLGRALSDLRSAGDSVALADAEAAAMLRSYLEALLAEREAIEEAGAEPDAIAALERRIEDHRDRLHIAVELVDAEHNAWQAVVGLGVAEALGPVLAVQSTLAPRLERASVDADAYQATIELHLGQLRGALAGLADIAAREQLDLLIDKVEGGAAAIGGALGAAIRPGLALLGEGLGKLISDLSTGALVDAALGEGVDLPSRLQQALGNSGEASELGGLLESAANVALDHAPELITAAIETDELMRQIDHFSEQGHEAILGVEDACMALLLGSATAEVPLAATEGAALSRGLAAVADLIASGRDDLETWRGVVEELRATGGADLFALR